MREENETNLLYSVWNWVTQTNPEYYILCVTHVLKHWENKQCVKILHHILYYHGVVGTKNNMTTATFE